MIATFHNGRLEAETKKAYLIGCGEGSDGSTFAFWHPKRCVKESPKGKGLSTAWVSDSSWKLRVGRIDKKGYFRGTQEMTVDDFNGSEEYDLCFAPEIPKKK